MGSRRPDSVSSATAKELGQLFAEPGVGGRVDVHLPEQGVDLSAVLTLLLEHVPHDVGEADGHRVRSSIPATAVHQVASAQIAGFQRVGQLAHDIVDAFATCG